MDERLLVDAGGITVQLGGREVLSNAAASVRAGSIVTLIGPNGAGKTTLVKVLLGLLEPDSGRVYRRPGLRVGYMPQNLQPDPALPMSVGRFLEVGVARRAARERRLDVLQEVGGAALLDTSLCNISGGELQRVMLARALLREPEFLVLDEPVQGVDVGGQAELYRLIGRIRETRGCGVLLVSHDLHLVMAATDHVICLNQHVCCAGHPESVTRDPAFINLFGEHVAHDFAIYHHRHDHRHDADGTVVPLMEDEGGTTEGAAHG